jgi:hypothetical protein
VKQTGRDVATMKMTRERRATELLSKRERQRELQEFETKARGLLTLIENMKKTEAEEQGTDTDEEDYGNTGSGFGVSTGTGMPAAAACATRHGLGTKRKHEEEELIRHLAVLNKLSKRTKEQRRQS